jgi:hypothetical protein
VAKRRDNAGFAVAKAMIKKYGVFNDRHSKNTF